MISLKSSIKPNISIRPQAITANTNGIGVDALDFNDALVVLEVGVVSGTTPTLDVKIQESDDDSSYSDISGATFTQVTAANNSQVLRVDLRTGRKRYLRAVCTVGGTSPSFETSVVILLGKKTRQPV